MGKNTTKHKTFDEKFESWKGSKTSHLKWKFADFGEDGGNAIKPLKNKWE